MPGFSIGNPYQRNPSAVSAGSATQTLLPGPTPTGAVTVAQDMSTPNALGDVPFVQAAKRFSQVGNQQSLISLNPPGQFNNIIPAYGLWRGTYFNFNATGGTGVAAVAYEDAPFSAITNLTIFDRSGAPLTSLDGYSWFLTQLYGGYNVFRPDGDGKAFTNVQTNGNWQFIMPWMLEFGAYGKGCLPNDNAQAAYQFNIQFGSALSAATGPIYTTQPTTIPTVTATVTLLARMKPQDYDPATAQHQIATPPGYPLFQTWSLQTVTLAAGLNNVPITRVGNVWRNLILIFRSATNGTRATAETDGTVPVNIFLKWDAATLRLQNTIDIRQEAFQQTGISTLNGVVPILFTPEAQNLQGETDGFGYIPTSLGANMQLQVTNAGPANGKLTILLNDCIVPANSNLYEVPELAHAHPAISSGR